MQTITRKFLVKKNPDLSGLEKTAYNRFYLYNESGKVIRVQKIDDKYELERKEDKSELIRDEQKIIITQKEFEKLSFLTNQNIVRDSYQISENPKIKLRIYHGKFEGLVRAEVSFNTEKEAEAFTPLEWFGEEITSSPLAKDGSLLKLSSEEFNQLIKS
jgi:adenylate cyclase